MESLQCLRNQHIRCPFDLRGPAPVFQRLGTRCSCGCHTARSGVRTSMAPPLRSESVEHRAEEPSHASTTTRQNAVQVAAP